MFTPLTYSPGSAVFLEPGTLENIIQIMKL